MRTEQRKDGKIIAIAGASGGGKSAKVKQEIKSDKRLLIWDTRNEYLELDNVVRVSNPSELARMLKETGKKAKRIVYNGPLQDFESFCELAYVWIQKWPATIIAEEVSDVTNPGKAPPFWGELVRKGRYYGGYIYSITQRPQECDKTVWGNAMLRRVHMLEMPGDMAYLESKIGIPLAELQSLAPLEYLEKRRGVDKIERGKVKF